MGATNEWKGGEVVVLHELAHAVLPSEHHHDRRWVRTFLEFVGRNLSQDLKKMLMKEFKLNRIPYSPVKAVRTTNKQLQQLMAARSNRSGKKDGEDIE
jgi:hypothetical protein